MAREGGGIRALVGPCTRKKGVSEVPLEDVPWQGWEETEGAVQKRALQEASGALALGQGQRLRLPSVGPD